MNIFAIFFRVHLENYTFNRTFVKVSDAVIEPPFNVGFLFQKGFIL